MPNDPRISSLRELLRHPLSVESLEKLARGLQDLAQDRAEPSTLFVLQTIADKLASELEGEAVEYHRFRELTMDIPENMTRVLFAIQEGRSAAADLNSLVTTFYRNLGLYRSR
jgi:hypothetical protein